MDNEISYTVTRTEFGIYVKGPLPVSEMLALLEAWQDVWDMADAKVSGRLGASLAVTNKENSDKWREHLGIYEESEEAADDGAECDKGPAEQARG